MLYSEILAKAAETYPDKVGLIVGDVGYTFSDIKNRVDVVAANLAKQGLKKGDFASIYLTNSLENLVVTFAYFKLGAISVPIRSQLTCEHVAHIIKQTNPKVLVTDENLLPILREAIDISGSDLMPFVIANNKSNIVAEHDFNELFTPIRFDESQSEVFDVGPLDIATILYTSGSTGAPKGAMHQHQQWLNNVRLASSQNFVADDVTMVALNINHCYGFGEQVLAAWYAGATIVLKSSFNAEHFLEAVTSGIVVDDRCYIVNYFCGVPSMYHAIVQASKGQVISHHLKCLDYAGDVLPLVVQQKIIHSFGEGVLRPSYGMTEAFCISDHHNYKAGMSDKTLIGKPRACVEVKVFNPETQLEVTEGGVGELCIKSPSVCVGYLGSDARQTDTIQGYFRTGDAVRQNSQGQLFYVNRIKRLMVSPYGYNIDPRELEDKINTAEGVAASCVFDIKDQEGASIIVAMVALNNLPETTLSADFLFHLFDGLNLGHRPDIVSMQTTPFVLGSTGKVAWQFYQKQASEELAAPGENNSMIYDRRSL